MVGVAVKLYENWTTIVRRAWSMRLMALAVVLTAVEVVLPLYADQFPRHVFAILSAAAVIGAMVSRIVAQKDV